MSVVTLPEVPRRARQALRPLGLASLAGLCGAAALHALLLVPAQDRLAQTRAAYEEARRHAMVLQHNRMTQERVRDLERRLNHVWATLPAVPDFNSLAIEIAELARSAGVSVPGMTHTHKKGRDGLPAKASLVFQAAGTYPDIYTFIHKLETMDRYLAIEQLEASRRTGARRDGGVQFNIRVVTFLKAGPEPAHAS